MFQTNIYYVARMSVELHLQQQLEAAQNVLFCEELFSQLARESMGLQAPIPVSLPASSRSNINTDMPELSSGPVCIPRKRRLAGPVAADRHSWLELVKVETLLEQLVRQAQYVVDKFMAVRPNNLIYKIINKSDFSCILLLACH